MFDKFKNLIGVTDLEDEIQEDVYKDELDLKEKKERKDRKGYREKMPKEEIKDRYKGSIKNIDADLYILKPENYNECASIVDELKRKKTIVLNLENVDKELKKLIFEFTKGGVYALEANIQKVSNDIFLIAPKGTEIEGKIKINTEKNVFRWE
ncbi:MAG: cell division protein SepF [Bacillota bacterium]|nr:cell division protein SepF [Bacillota bacterium]